MDKEGVAVCEACSKKPLSRNKLFIITSFAILLILASFFIPSLEPFRKGFLDYLKAIWWAVVLGLF